MVEPMTLRQVTGFLNSPRRTEQRLSETAQRALLKVDELEAQVRHLEETVAAVQVDTPIVVVLHRSGYVEVRAAEHQSVKIVCRPDLGRDREEEADAWVAQRLPWYHRQIVEPNGGKVITAGHVSGCMDRWRFDALMQQLDQLAALKELEERSAKTIEGPPEADA